jgi:hypothetical protein
MRGLLLLFGGLQFFGQLRLLLMDFFLSQPYPVLMIQVLLVLLLLLLLLLLLVR